MKTIYTIALILGLNLLYAQDSQNNAIKDTAENPAQNLKMMTEDLQDFTPIFSIRSVQTGIFLSVNHNSKKAIEHNWKLREILLSDKLKQKDRLAKALPFGYVQFVEPLKEDSCLAIDESGFFVAKSCQKDLDSGALETVFSILPTNTTAVQIRSLVLESNECMTTFDNPRVPIEKRFGILPCTLSGFLFIDLSELFILAPPLIEAAPLQ